jgi:hypothetical protein
MFYVVWNQQHFFVWFTLFSNNRIIWRLGKARSNTGAVPYAILRWELAGSCSRLEIDCWFNQSFE